MHDQSWTRGYSGWIDGGGRAAKAMSRALLTKGGVQLEDQAKREVLSEPLALFGWMGRMTRW